MTKEDFCKRCSRYAGCGFISRELQDKCDILQIFEEGYEQGYEDVINKACEWLDKRLNNYNISWIEDEYCWSKEMFLKQFKQSMKGE